MCSMMLHLLICSSMHMRMFSSNINIRMKRMC